jgi:hypothetical protein
LRLGGSCDRSRAGFRAAATRPESPSRAPRRSTTARGYHSRPKS